MPIVVERQDATAVVTINRPEALNALDLEHLEQLDECVTELASDVDIRAVVITGAGEKAFIAGADIGYMRDLDVLGAHAWGVLGHRVGEMLETMPKPTIAAVNGFALGGGCELALACDLRLAASNAKFGQPEVNLGIIPGWGGSQRLARTTSLGFAKELVFTGRMVDAEESLARGLVNAVHPGEELLETTVSLAKEMASKSPLVMDYAKKSTNLALQGEHATSLETEARLFAMLFSSEDRLEGMSAFLEKRTPTFKGC